MVPDLARLEYRFSTQPTLEASVALFNKTSSSSLWEEDPSDRRKAALAITIAARARLSSLAPDIPVLEKEITSFISDLDYISEALSKVPDEYRKIRPFTAVHLPSIVASLEALSTLEKTEGNTDRIAMLETDIKTCLQAATHARATLQNIAETALEVETAVLKEKVKEASPEQPSNDGSQAGLVGKFKIGAFGVSQKLTAPLLKGVSESGKQVATLQDSALSRLDAGAGLAYGYVSGLVEDGIDIITSPISRRVGAIGSALESASTTAIAGGLVTAIIFPPAIPIAMGIALMDGADTYGKALEEAERKSASDKTDRQQKRSQESAARLARLQGKSPVVRIETSHVHVSMNSETGECQGVILTGLHAGENMQSLDNDVLDQLAKTAPDQETGKIIRSFLGRKSRGAQQEAATHRKDPSHDSLGLAALGLEALALTSIG
jgi:hypothetical protein